MSEPLTDDVALNIIANWLRDPDWGVGMLEDIADVVTRTGRTLDNPDEISTWRGTRPPDVSRRTH